MTAAMIDLDRCEWNPGSNRSTVDPVVAVGRLEMPAPMRATLIEKMKRHHFDDVVSITWATITSDSNANSYDGAISRMNFAAGRICRAVTRHNWSADHVEGAIVYIVEGRAFGYASACGNLFEMRIAEAPAARPGRDALDVRLVDGPEETLDATIADPQMPEAVTLGTEDSPGTTSGGPAFTPGWAATPSFGGDGYVTHPELVSSIPEPHAWALLLAGLGAVGFVARRRAL